MYILRTHTKDIYLLSADDVVYVRTQIILLPNMGMHASPRQRPQPTGSMQRRMPIFLEPEIPRSYNHYEMIITRMQ